MEEASQDQLQLVISVKCIKAFGLIKVPFPYTFKASTSMHDDVYQPSRLHDPPDLSQHVREVSLRHVQ